MEDLLNLSLRAETLDTLRISLFQQTEKNELNTALADLVICLNLYFKSRSVLSETDLRELEIALTYIDYIMNYLAFMNIHPTDMADGLILITEDLKDKIIIITQELQKVYNVNWICHYQEMESRIVGHLEHFKKLFAMKLKGHLISGVYQFPKLHGNYEINDSLQLIYGILTTQNIDFYNDEDYEAELMANFCKRLDNLRILTTPIHILDLVFSLLVFSCNRKENYPDSGADSYTTEWIMKWSIITTSRLMLLGSMTGIVGVHRAHRLAYLTLRTGADVLDYNMIDLSEKFKLPRFEVYGLPKFQGIPEVGEIPSQFWSTLKKKHDLTNYALKFSCGICFGSLLNIKKCAILDSCNHEFCEECIGQWFSEAKSCPLCRLEVNRWTNWRLAKAYTEFTSRKLQPTTCPQPSVRSRFRDLVDFMLRFIPGYNF